MHQPSLNRHLPARTDLINHQYHMPQTEIQQRTIDGTLKLLITDFARELANTGFLIELDRDALLMITEQAGEDDGKRCILNINTISILQPKTCKMRDGPFWALGAS